MSLGILTNVAATYAENNLNQTQNSLNTVLQQLSSGSRINSGADDAAGLSISDGLAANEAALTQSAENAQNGVGLAADGGWRVGAGDQSAEPRDHAGYGGLERWFDDGSVGCRQYGVSEHRDRDRQHRHVDELQQHGGLFEHGDELCRQRRNDDRHYDVLRYGGRFDLRECRHGKRWRNWTEFVGRCSDQHNGCTDGTDGYYGGGCRCGEPARIDRRQYQPVECCRECGELGGGQPVRGAEQRSPRRTMVRRPAIWRSTRC